MIRQHELVSFLAGALPEFSEERMPAHALLRPYAAISQFTQFTRLAVNQHHYHIARKCFLLAEKLYKDGDPIVKQLVDNYFIYSFSGYLSAKKSAEVRRLIPPDLYKVYVKEMINNHC